MRNYVPNLKNGHSVEGLKPSIQKPLKKKPISSTNNEDKKEDTFAMNTNPVMRDLFNVAHSLTFEVNNQTVWEKVKKGIYDAIKDNPFVSSISVQCDRNTNPRSVIRNNLIGLRVSYFDHFLNKRDSIEFNIPLKVTED